MKKNLLLLFCLSLSGLCLAQTDRAGIGTTTPRTGLDVQHNDGLLATGEFLEGNTDNLPTGTGTRLMWVPKLAAFRAGALEGSNGNNWNFENLGSYSVALGLDTRASGRAALAIGESSRAEGSGAVALGHSSSATGERSMALAGGSSAGENGVAIGLGSTSTNFGALALANGIASGEGAVAIGPFAKASGKYAVAIGTKVTADGQNSTAMGQHVTTGGYLGGFIIGDASPDDPGLIKSVDRQNQFVARFVGGYKLYTNASGSAGVEIAIGGNSWSTISDSTKKEIFREADGASFLRKIARMRLGSWNYKGQDPQTFRHYGPMAQDFFAAFGHDGIGTIGDDKTINQADFDGVNLIAIQALARENEARQAEIKALRAELAALKAQNAALNQETAILRSDVESIKRLLVANTGK